MLVTRDLRNEDSSFPVVSIVTVFRVTLSVRAFDFRQRLSVDQFITIVIVSQISMVIHYELKQGEQSIACFEVPAKIIR